MKATDPCVWLLAGSLALLPSTVCSCAPKLTAETHVDRWTPGTSFRDCADCPVMVLVPAGSFTMGSPLEEEGRGRSEGPQRRVLIPRMFAVRKFEVTRGEFARFAEETSHSASDGCHIFTGNEWRLIAERGWQDPGYPQTGNHPVTCISWRDAKAYVAWLTAKTGRRYRLLTEAEWEYAARAGSVTIRHWGDAAEFACRHANVADQTAKATFASWSRAFQCSDAHTYTAPVGSFLGNAFGLHDMLGNAAEWTEDCWNASYIGAPSDGGPFVTGTRRLRVLRGGSFSGAAFGIRAAARSGGRASARWFYWGFRVARTL